jgi:hypothetical protein
MLAQFSTILFLISFSVFSQMQKPCMTKTGRVDTSCSCAKKKSCMKAISSNEIKLIKRLNQKIGKNYILKGLKEQKVAIAETNKFFSGQTDFKNFPYKKIDKVLIKQEKENKKLVKRFEKKVSKKAKKPISIAKLTQKIKTKKKRVIDRIVKPALESGKIGIAAVDLKSISRGSGVSIATVENKIPQTEAELIQAIKENKSLSKEEKQRKIAESKANTALKTKKYKMNDINKDTNKNIFKIISYRYLKRLGSVKSVLATTKTTERSRSKIKPATSEFSKWKLFNSLF